MTKEGSYLEQEFAVTCADPTADRMAMGINMKRPIWDPEQAWNQEHGLIAGLIADLISLLGSIRVIPGKGRLHTSHDEWERNLFRRQVHCAFDESKSSHVKLDIDEVSIEDVYFTQTSLRRVKVAIVAVSLRGC